MEKRRCQINAIYPITCFTVPIIGHTELKLTTDEIYKCLCAKAEVTEILEDGKMVSLDFSNYDKPIIITDNSKTVEKPKEVITEPVEVKEPTVEEKELEVILEAKDEVKVEDETVVETKNETEVVEEVSTKENSTTKSYEVPSRNNNNRKQQNNYKNKNRNHTKNKR